MNLIGKYLGVEESAPTVGFEEQVEILQGEMQASLEALDIISAEMSRIESSSTGTTSLSMESFSEEFLDLLENKVIFGTGVEGISLEEDVGGISGILTRLWQVYFMEFLKSYDILSDLFKSFNGESKKYKEKFADLKSKLKEVSKDHLHFKTSYAGMDWLLLKVVDKRLKPTTTPIKDLEDIKVMNRAILIDHVKEVNGAMSALTKVVSKADFEDSSNAQKAIDDLTKQKTPLEKIPSNILTAYLGGYSLVIEDRSKSLLGKLGLTSGKKMSLKPTEQSLLNKLLSGWIIPDVSMDAKEIGQLIDNSLDILDITGEFFKNTKGMEKEAQSLRKSFDTAFSKLKKAKDIDEATVKRLSMLAKELTENQLHPAIEISKYNHQAVKAVRYLCDRLIANPVKG